MSRPWIFGIVCFGLLLGTTSIGWAQEEDSSQSVSLVERFASLKNKFRREQPEAKTPTKKSSQRSNRHNSRPRQGGKTSAKRSQRSQAPKVARLPASAPSKFGIQASDLLPDAVFVRENNTSTRESRPQEPWDLTRTANLPRAGSKVSLPATKQLARKSPTTLRANELNDALADLLQEKDAERSVPVALKPSKKVKSVKRSTPPTPQVSASVLSNTFDLRQALLEGEEKATEDAIEVAEAPEEKTLVVQPVEEIKPQVVIAPVIVAVPAKSKFVEKVIVPELIVPKVIEQKVVAGTSDGEARQAFAGPGQTRNPMRSFLPTVEKAEPVKTIAAPSRDVLRTAKQPVIVSHVEGPRSILVGQEATFQVTLENTSNTPSSDLSAEIRVPEWAELVDAMSTGGVVERVSQGTKAGALEWKLSELAPHASQSLRLRLIPRSGRPLKLDVRWSQAAVESQAIVEVQEPKLELSISGPKEVHFGKPQRYRLTLRNPGTGVTEKVSVRLVPPGGTAQDATTQRIGDLQPGEVKDLDLELTAREAGELLIQASAFSEGGLKSAMNKKVLCRKPELEVDWRGPEKKYAGTVAAYYFRVSNPGTAATDSVSMSLKLPAGAKFVSASDGYSVNSTTGVVSWELGAIAAAGEQFVQMRCKIAKAGKNDFEILASANDGELNAKKAFQTEVEALADLKLEVTDPQGPLPMGEPVVYQIRVSNRGTTAAEGISIVGLFSEGIDPTTIEGAQFSVRDGRVSFHPIKSLAAGREVLLRIHAKANQVGTHIFRAEVACQKLDIKLAAEETTRFFEDEHRWKDGETPYSAERKASVAR